MAAVACLRAWSGTVFANDPSQQTGKTESTVSPLLQQFIQERGSVASQQGGDEITRSQSDAGLMTKDAQVTADDGSSDASDDPVRFDSSGNLQVYIHLENTGDATLQQLSGPGVCLLQLTANGQPRREPTRRRAGQRDKDAGISGSENPPRLESDSPEADASALNRQRSSENPCSQKGMLPGNR